MQNKVQRNEHPETPILIKPIFDRSRNKRGYEQMMFWKVVIYHYNFNVYILNNYLKLASRVSILLSTQTLKIKPTNDKFIFWLMEDVPKILREIFLFFIYYFMRSVFLFVFFFLSPKIISRDFHSNSGVPDIRLRFAAKNTF